MSQQQRQKRLEKKRRKRQVKAAASRAMITQLEQDQALGRKVLREGFNIDDYYIDDVDAAGNPVRRLPTSSELYDWYGPEEARRVMTAVVELTDRQQIA